MDIPLEILDTIFKFRKVITGAALDDIKTSDLFEDDSGASLAKLLYRFDPQAPVWSSLSVTTKRHKGGRIVFCFYCGVSKCCKVATYINSFGVPVVQSIDRWRRKQRLKVTFKVEDIKKATTIYDKPVTERRPQILDKDVMVKCEVISIGQCHHPATLSMCLSVMYLLYSMSHHNPGPTIIQLKIEIVKSVPLLFSFRMAFQNLRSVVIH